MEAPAPAPINPNRLIGDAERNHDATVYVGNIDENVNEALLWELFSKAGPVLSVHIPKDKVTNLHSGYGFAEFMTADDADYAMKTMNLIRLYGKPIRVNKAVMDKTHTIDIGANLFIGSLDPQVDEKTLFDTFSSFGPLTQTPKIGRDDHGESRGFGFISFATFDAADAAIEAMNGQFIFNKAVNVAYALKKDGKGERHGSVAERTLAAKAKKIDSAVLMQNGSGSTPLNASGKPLAISR